jgi:hypothetical protein
MDRRHGARSDLLRAVSVHAPKLERMLLDPHVSGDGLVIMIRHRDPDKTLDHLASMQLAPQFAQLPRAYRSRPNGTAAPRPWPRD